MAILCCVGMFASLHAVSLDGTSGSNLSTTDQDTTGDIVLDLQFLVEYLVVGGGGGGGAGSAISAGGGGGAGEFISNLGTGLSIGAMD